MAEPIMGLNFEYVWATLQENARQQQETDKLLKELADEQKKMAEENKKMAEERRLSGQEIDKLFTKMAEETDKRFKELAEERRLSRQETDKLFTKMAEETGRRFKELTDEYKKMQRALGIWGNRVGKVVEHLVKAGLVEKFNELGYAFTHPIPRVIYKKENGDPGAEVDILLEDNNTIIAVEAKTTLMIEHVKAHIKRMAFLREYADRRGDTRRCQGALAGVIISAEVRNFALEKGFFLIEPSGRTTIITTPPMIKSWQLARLWR